VRRHALKLAMLVVLMTAGVVAASFASANDGLDSGLAAVPSTDAATSSDSTSTETASEPTTTVEVTEPVTTEPPPDPVTVEDPGLTDSTPVPGPETNPTPADGGGKGSNPSPQPAAHHHHSNTARPLELEGAYPTVWLHRVLPDPTPPAKRLAPAFARLLREVQAEKRVSWTILLGVLRASGHESRRPATPARLLGLATRLVDHGARRHPWRAIAQLRSHKFANRAVALARYDRAVGLRALVRGLAARKAHLERQILRDRRIDLYAGGRFDIAYGRVDVRVLVLLRYMVVTFHQVTVSSLITGHRFFARPRVKSAHVDGLAVDISALAHTTIYGHQQPGGITERAIEKILLLPVEVQPQQVISLLGLGGPSFPLADHYDHIHVGF
jgi:hypothetical protein